MENLGSHVCKWHARHVSEKTLPIARTLRDSKLTTPLFDLVQLLRRQRPRVERVDALKLLLERALAVDLERRVEPHARQRRPTVRPPVPSTNSIQMTSPFSLLETVRRRLSIDGHEVVAVRVVDHRRRSSVRSRAGSSSSSSLKSVRQGPTGQDDRVTHHLNVLAVRICQRVRCRNRCVRRCRRRWRGDDRGRRVRWRGGSRERSGGREVAVCAKEIEDDAFLKPIRARISSQQRGRGPASCSRGGRRARAEGSLRPVEVWNTTPPSSISSRQRTCHLQSSPRKPNILLSCDTKAQQACKRKRRGEGGHEPGRPPRDP